MQRERDDQTIVPAGEGTARDVGLLPLESVRGARVGAGGAAGGVGWTIRGGHAAAAGAVGLRRARAALGDGADPMGGSNNWVVAGARSRSGKPIVASDPHMPYEAASSFYEVHLSGGSFDAPAPASSATPG